MTATTKPSDAGMDEATLARLDAAVQADIDAGRHFDVGCRGYHFDSRVCAGDRDRTGHPVLAFLGTLSVAGLSMGRASIKTSPLLARHRSTIKCSISWASTHTNPLE